MAALLPTTPRVGGAARARYSGEVILATATLITLVGAVVTLADPEPSLGSAPIVVEASR